MKNLEYKKENTEGIVCVTVYDNKKIFFEIECFEDSPFTIEEEIQEYLDSNGFEDVDYDFSELKCKHSDAYLFHENAPYYCPECKEYIEFDKLN